jgi:antitoxin YefM
MKVLSLSQARIKLGSVLGMIERTDEPVTITRNGKPVAVIISKDKYDGYHETLEITKDDEFMKEIRAGILALRRTRRRFTIEELFSDKKER